MNVPHTPNFEMQILVDEDGCLVVYVPNYLDLIQVWPGELERECLETEPFQPMLKFKSIEVPQPRLITWMADDPELTYTYTGVFLEPKPMTPRTRFVAQKLEKDLGAPFPTCLLNLYRDGKDSVSWHSDNEKELGLNCTIATISLGAERTFELKHRKERPNRIVSTKLQHGSLLVMSGRTQSVWAHQVPKELNVSERRISLTFRPHVRAKRTSDSSTTS